MNASRESVQNSIEDRNGPTRNETLSAVSDESWPTSSNDEPLEVTEVSRDPRVESAMQRNHAANRLAAANRTNRLLWIALVLSLLAHVVVPICLVTAMTQPEKVALMDGTESVIIAPLVPVEQSDEILNTVSYWAAKSFLDRGPQGFDAPDTLNRVFLPEAAEKAKNEFKGLADEFKKKRFIKNLKFLGKNFHQTGGGFEMSE